MLAGYKYRYQFMVNGEIMINDRDSFSESKLGRLTNYKIASKENFNFEGFEEMLPPILEQVPSYIHPETKQLNKAKFLELKKQISYLSGTTISS